MWREQAVPRLQAGALGVDRASHTLRLTGIGESALVDESAKRYSARPTRKSRRTPGRTPSTWSSRRNREGQLSAQAIVDRTMGLLREKIGRYVFAEGDEDWSDALVKVIGERSLSIVEIGTAGQVAALLGDAPFLRFAELLRADDEVAHAHANLAHYAERAREFGHADIGVAVFARQTRDTHIRIAIASDTGVAELQRTAFLAGDEGRRRAALATAAALWQTLSSVATA